MLDLGGKPEGWSHVEAHILKLILTSTIILDWCDCCYRTKSSHLDYASVMEKAFETSNGWPQKYSRAARFVYG